MGTLVDFAIYNPGILSDDDFLAGYVARHDLTENLLGRLREVTPKGLARHQLILGQRGMGKTSLLRRLALGVSTDPKLSKVLLPLTFREEQYNVHNLHVFWCNCLDALGDWFEGTGQAAKAAEVDRDVARLCAGSPDPAGSDAADAFKAWARKEKRRPLLLLDNLDLILNGLAKQDWALRRALQEKGGVVVVGASATYLEATADKDAAFHDFFQVTVLEKLSADDMVSCLRRLAAIRGEAGKAVVRVLDDDPGRVRTLYDLTGGNPRTLVLLYLLLESDGGNDVMTDLERLLDQVTVLYKARVEDLAPQQRVVLDAVAIHWDPATAAQVAEATRLEIQPVSSQLDRLLKAGVIEKASVSTTTKAAYQVAERFFNIWYLMRHGPRRQRARLRWLTEFLRGFYTSAQLEAKARRILAAGKDEGPDQAAYYVALSDAIDEPQTRNALLAIAQYASRGEVEKEGPERPDTVDMHGLPGPNRATEWLGAAVLLYDAGRTDEFFNSIINASRVNDGSLEAFAHFTSASIADMRKNKTGVYYATSFEVYISVGLGDTLLDFSTDYAGAETQYRKALSANPGNRSVEAGLFMALALQPSKAVEADDLFKSLVARFPPIESAILSAYRAIVLENTDEALGILATVLEAPPSVVLDSCWKTLLQTLRLCTRRGLGHRVLTWMDDSGSSVRYWPLRVAYAAYVSGVDSLGDVNPEVRETAKEILEYLAPKKMATVALSTKKSASKLARKRGGRRR